jgi:ribosomal protein S18 acetylase RimI-like enzyme
VAKPIMRIRQGTAADNELLYPIYKVLRPKDAVSKEDFARLLGAVLEEHTELWIADDPATPGKPIGFLTLRIGTTLHGRRSGTIEELVVDPKARRAGAGRSLVEKAIERARHAGCWSMELATYEDSPDASGFYQKFGFKSSSKFYRLQI